MNVGADVLRRLADLSTPPKAGLRAPQGIGQPSRSRVLSPSTSLRTGLSKGIGPASSEVDTDLPVRACLAGALVQAVLVRSIGKIAVVA